MFTNQQVWKLYTQYANAWKPNSDQQRTKMLADVLDKDFHYLTPEFEGGLDTLLEDMAGIQKKVPGGYFDVEDVSTHHDVALLTWKLVQPGGTVLVKGHDQIRVSPEGKIVDLLTFAPSVSEP
ncbi:MAG: nuclear transport factor 2 family protein [Edaphobacter sp.]|jgi:hypothetical protein